jgi:DNA-binding MarR family transcriptional regulator/GNAT superfamily N-acetyltransferase
MRASASRPGTRRAGQSDFVDRVRGFNRFYTRRIGALDEGHLDSDFSLAEVRVLYELAHCASPTATELAAKLGLDAGYLSRMLGRFERGRLVERAASRRDARQSHLRLTSRGRRVFRGLDRKARRAIEQLARPLSEADRSRLLGAMEAVEAVLADGATRVDGRVALRPPRPGDLGWVVQRHGVLYAQEYGWNAAFEGLVAGIVADFAAHLEPAREKCWIAELDGRSVGSIFLVRHPERDGVAKLRLLLVEPSARGHGVGRSLVEECLRFARQSRYRRVTLWTQSILASARRIYEGAGFRLVDEKPHRSFGADLVGQTWELELAGAGKPNG